MLSRRVAGLIAACVAMAPALAAAAPFEGSVLDGTTLKPIRGAQVTAPDGTVAKADKVGHFRFADLPAGPLDLAVSADGYEPGVESVEVLEGGVADYIIILFTPGAASEIIEVEDSGPVPPPPGRQTLDRKEINRIPGTRGDALTAVRSLPGVGSGPAAGNGPSQVVIRGSAPEDSKITIDGIEIPILYHFFGLQSVLPSEFIDTIEFLPGGFGAEEGRATGGVINVSTRAEAITKPEGFAELSFINLAAFFQTPLSVKNGLQLSGALRRSTIDFILPAVIPDDANVNFTTAPQYYDGQLRLDWRPREGDRVSVFAIGSYDLLSLLNDNLDPNEPDFAGVFDNETWFTRTIASWHHGKKSFRDNRLVGAIGNSGFRLEIGPERYLRFGQRIAEIRDDLTYTIDDRLRLRAGAEAKLDRRRLAIKFPAPPVEGQPPPSNFSLAPLITFRSNLSNNVAGAYAAADLRPVPALLVTSGVRIDHYAFLNKSTVSPRLQITEQIGDDWTIKLAMGAYSRGLESAESTDPSLSPERAFQYVLGGKYEIDEGVSVELSGFYTDRRRLVTTDLLLAQTDPLRAYVNRGIGRSYGGELLARAKTERFFGWVAYSLGRSDRVDAPDGMQRLFDFDQTHNFIAVGSYTLGKWELGARWQYATGTPMTPVTGSVYLSDVNAFIPVYGALNSERIEAAHQLDIRIDRRWTFNNWKLSAYLDITNVYAHARVLGYSYNYDYSERTAFEDLPFIPAIGVRGEL